MSIVFQAAVSLAIILAIALLEQEQQSYQKSSNASLQKKVNYAASSGGAIVIQASPYIRKPHNVLRPDRDRFLHFVCSDKQDQPPFMVVSLTSQIFIQKIKFGLDVELSNVLSRVRVYSSLQQKEWKLLAEQQLNRSLPEIVPLHKTLVYYLRLEFIKFVGPWQVCSIAAIEVYGRPILRLFEPSVRSQFGGQRVAQSQINSIIEMIVRLDQRIMRLEQMLARLKLAVRTIDRQVVDFQQLLQTVFYFEAASQK